MTYPRKPLRIELIWRRLAGLMMSGWDPSARLGIASRLYRRMALVWLRPLEAIARRLLLLEALALAPEPAVNRGRQSRAARPRPQKPTPAPPSLRRPETWRANFRILPTRRRRQPYVWRARPSHDQPTFPIARRIEALRRVIANRERYVRRLAGILRARPYRVHALRRAPACGYRSSAQLLAVVHARALAACWDSS